MNRVLSLHSQLCLYRAKLWHSLQDTLNELTSETSRGVLASFHKVYPTGAGGATRIKKRRIAKDKTRYLLTNPGSDVDLKCSNDEGSNTDENRRAERFHKEEKSTRVF